MCELTITREYELELTDMVNAGNINYKQTKMLYDAHDNELEKVVITQITKAPILVTAKIRALNVVRKIYNYKSNILI